MLLVGWEIKEAEHSLFTISPPRTGRVWYYCEIMLDYLAPSRIAEMNSARERWGRESTREFYQANYPQLVALFAADRCSCTKPVIHGKSVLLKYSHLRAVILAHPLDWEGLPGTPDPLVSGVFTYGQLATGRFGGVFGALRMDVLPLPSELLLKPGTDFSMSTEVTPSRAGATIRGSILNEFIGKRATTDTPLNVGETARVAIADTMPALLPGQVASWEASYSVKLCDIRNLVKTDEAYRMVTGDLEQAIPPAASFITTVKPTDCMLADIGGGVVEILGDDLSYEGFIVARDRVGPLSGSAPERLTFSDLMFLRLDFNREIAVCEDGNLFDANGKTYEYSAFPTPFMAAQRGRYVMASLRPTLPWEGPPGPRFATIGPRIRAERG